MFLKLSVFICLSVYVLCDDVLRFDQKNGDGKTCPNGRVHCQYRQTCCETKHGSYHCCRYSNAVCCPDKYHCCPHGSRCDTRRKRCIRPHGASHPIVELYKSDPVEWKLEDEQVKTPIDTRPSVLEPHPDNAKVKDEVTCPNNKTTCKDTKTCCITKHGNYYCCPHKNAVCCPDKYHCCPEGSTCDAKTNKCSGSVPQISMHQFPSRSDHHELDKKCPNSEKGCPGKKRCCNMDGGAFGCCEYNKGVCCADMKTCCPHGTKCNVAKKTCEAYPQALKKIFNDKEKIDAKKSLLMYISTANLKNVCPNGGKCPGTSTCCALVTPGQYGCCPYQKGVCCSDKKTCCPTGRKCTKEGCR